MATKKLNHAPDGFNLYDLNGHCKTCGALSDIEYRGLDPIFPDFRIVCHRCETYAVMKIRMMLKYLTPEPYRGRRLFEKWNLKYGRW
jgi:hypothetical protein